MVVRPGRVVAPVIHSRFFRRDIVAGTKAAAFGTQQHDAGRRVGIGQDECFGQLPLQLRTDGVELLRPVQGDDRDLVVHLVQYQAIAHPRSPPKKRSRL